MYFSAEALLWILKTVIQKAGGEVTVATESGVEDCLLMFEGSEEGDKIKLKVVRVDESAAGHA